MLVSPGLLSSPPDLSLEHPLPASSAVQLQTPTAGKEGGPQPLSSISSIPALLSPLKPLSHCNTLQKVTIRCKSSTKRKVTPLIPSRALIQSWSDHDHKFVTSHPGGRDDGGRHLRWHQTPLQWGQHRRRPWRCGSIRRRSGRPFVHPGRQLFSLPSSAASRCPVEARTISPLSLFTFNGSLERKCSQQ